MPATEPGIALPARYRVVRRIASGGMATVWSAEDVTLGRTVAVKVLHDALAEDEDAKTRFLREARAGARLSDHPHVVTVYDLGEHEGRAYMVMEQMLGGSLAGRLGTGRKPPVRLALRWLAEAAGALDHAHLRDIVHRDVKPANLLLDERNRLAVADFGIAVVAGEASVTQTGLVMGTASYLAPEQAMGQPATAASDRYALAVVAFELLTGEKPFAAEGAAGQARAHVEQAPPPPSRIAPDVPPSVDDVMARGLAKLPEHRPLTASAFVDELAHALGRADDATAATAVLERTRPAGAVGAAAAAAAIEPTHPGAGWAAAHRDPTPLPAREAPERTPAPWAAEPPARHRRSRWPAVLMAVGAMALAGGAGAAILTGGDDSPSRTAADATTQAPAATQDEPQAEAAQSQTPTTEQEAEPAPTPAPAEAEAEQAEPETGGGSGAGDPAALNDRGYALLQGGRPGEAVPVLQRSVEGFRAQGRTSELPYAFALFNLGRSLRLSGQPAQAIPFLEERLKFDNQRDVVEAELARARAAAGQGGGEQQGEDDGGGNGTSSRDDGKDKKDKGKDEEGKGKGD